MQNPLQAIIPSTQHREYTSISQPLPVRATKLKALLGHNKPSRPHVLLGVSS